MRYDASTYGNDGRAIQACIDVAVVDQSRGAARDATIYVPRLRGQKAWVLSQPLRIGPGWQVSIEGDGGAGADWGGTLLDASMLSGPAIHYQGGTGCRLVNLAIRAGSIGVHFDGDSTQAISSCRIFVENVSIKSTRPGAIGVLIRGHGRFDEWGGVRLCNDQVASETVFSGVHIDVPNGVGFQCASKQAVNVWLEGCSIGARTGVLVECGGVHVTRCNFGGPAGCVHVMQYGQPQHYSEVHLTETYHEGQPAACFRGVGSNNRPTRILGCRMYLQASGLWLDAPGFEHLLARDCVFESAPNVTGANRCHASAMMSRPTYVRW